MQTVFQLPESIRADLDDFARQSERLKSGNISAAEYRAFRVPRGVYEQRESDTYMLRVRFPAGVVLPHQMRTLARVSRRYANGILHLTSRQDIQIHRVLLDDIHAALVELHSAGLSTKGGGGNTVRNITGCCDAGVCPREAFDVSGHVVALTEFLLPDPLSFQLPRKYKIAFSGCSRDCAGATVNDLGFVARQHNGAAGFAVYVAGGMGASARVAERLEEFVPAGEIHLIAEAVKRVFDQHGNRRNRQRARLRFLIEEIGLERFRALYQKELAVLRQGGVPNPSVRQLPSGPTAPTDPETTPSEGFSAWQRACTEAQKQEGYYLAHVPLVLGDIDAERLERLADVVDQHGDRTARTTQRQNFVLRWIGRGELGRLYARLDSIGLAAREPAVLRNLVACTGASTCRLGICLSRGLALAVRDALREANLAPERLGDFKINISGCPNSCGRHPVADVGLFGAARRVHGRLVPHYVLQLGGVVGEGRTKLARGTHAIPARNVPALLVELLDAFARSTERPDFSAFLAGSGEGLVETLAATHKNVPDFRENKSCYFDWGAKELFSVAGRGPGECGAGVFDLIEVDLASAGEAIRQSRRFDATVLAARSLLVTRGQQANDAAEALDLFSQYFVRERLVDETLARVVGEARRAAGTADPESSFAVDIALASQFVDAIRKLYGGMDASLRFKPVVEPSPPPPTVHGEGLPIADREVDFRGVVCPLNYVRTKLTLGEMPSGAVLSVLLDEPGMRNVPPSVEKDGHEVLAVTQEGDRWKVLIRKA